MAKKRTRKHYKKHHNIISSYNFILESKEEKQLIEDLTKKVKLEKQFSQQ